MAMREQDHVFIVDDDSSARKGLKRLLFAAGFNVNAYDSADKFLDAMDSKIDGCLILDSRLPGMSVTDMVAELHAHGSNIAIIMVSGDDDSKTRQKAKDIKAVGFFRKPVDGSALLDAIEWALKKV